MPPTSAGLSRSQRPAIKRAGQRSAAHRRARLGALVLFLTLAASCGSAGPGSGGSPGADGAGGVAARAGPPRPPDAFAADVTRVVDGDTFVARLNRGRVRVRLVGADAPESVRSGTPPACFGLAASAYTRRLLGGAHIWAAYEPGGQADRYGRKLWDAWLPDGRFVAGVLVQAGVARPLPVRPQVVHAAVLRRLGTQARAAGRGLWGPPCYGDSFLRRARG